MKQRLIDAAWRAARTFAQSFLAVYVVGVAGARNVSDFAATPVLQAAAVAGIAALLAFAVNALQTSGSVPMPKG